MLQQIIPTDRDIQGICKLIQEKLGLKFGSEKTPLIMSRLGKRLRDLNLSSYQEYLELVGRDRMEETVLINLLTTNVTSFFREFWQFRFLTEQVFPMIIGSKRNKTIRCWSSACATGEEAYSLGIQMLEYFPADWTLKILASDICTSSLHFGSQGIYSTEQLENLSENYVRKYFEPVDDRFYRVSEALRKTVFFRKINLYPENGISELPDRIIFDFIFCRNVFIYFTREAQRQAVDHFHRQLAPGGYLFLGHSESIDLTADPRWKPYKGCVYQKI